MQTSSIILIGPMGAGKSTIGRSLAAKIGFDFLDTDLVIEEKTGADIAWIFDVEGESGFRDRESQILRELAAAKRRVLATGGGIIVREENRDFLKDQEVVVYLKASIAQLIARTSKDKKRPLLQVENPVEKIKSLVAEREPFYQEVATHTVETDGHSPRATVQNIIKLLSE